MPPKKKQSQQPQLDDEAEYEFKINLIEVTQMYPEIYDLQWDGHKKEYICNAAWARVSDAMHAPGNNYITLNQVCIRFIL